VKVWTQDELMKEAVQTEILNRDSLAQLLRIEEHKKKLPPRRLRYPHSYTCIHTYIHTYIHTCTYTHTFFSLTLVKQTGPVTRFTSRGGKNTLTFTQTDTIPKCIHDKLKSGAYSE